MAYQNAVVAQARLWIGYREGPNNQNIFSPGFNRPAEAWCQDFVEFVSASAGYRQPIDTAGVVAAGNWAIKNNLFMVSTKSTPGCQILFDFNNGDGKMPVDPMKTHTGIFIGHGQTIEGNISDQVRVMNRTLGATNIWGAINWPEYWKSRPQPFATPLKNFPNFPLIQAGSRGAVVQAFQRGINDLFPHKLAVNGVYDTNTKAACEQFQKVSRITVDGQCGQQTWACLDIAINKL
jgi:peptidoglycan hydrolase-like protein with peptidoglycan-binding domain